MENADTALVAIRASGIHVSLAESVNLTRSAEVGTAKICIVEIGRVEIGSASG